MTGVTRDVEAILDAIDYGPEHLPHPIDLLSADLIAEVSGVPKTTLLSAALSLEAVRMDVLAATISRLGVAPGEATWRAMRESLAAVDAASSLGSVIDARAEELAIDPAFPFLLSGFDQLACDAVASAVGSACSHLASELAPFVDTVLHAAGEQHDVSTHESRMVLVSSVLALALQRLLGVGVGGTGNSSLKRCLTTGAGIGLLAEVRTPRPDELPTDPYVPGPVVRRATEGSLGYAVDAAADLLLRGAVPLRCGIKLDDVLRASGVSSATLYRKFGSIAGFERKLIERTGRSIVRAFRDDSFDDVLTAVANGSMEPIDAIGELQRRASEQMDVHIESKRPGAEVLPWMGVEVGTQVFVPAFQAVTDEWGAFFLDFATMLGLSLPEGIDGPAVAATLHSYSWVAELLTRNAPDRDLTATFVHARSAAVQKIVFGLA